MDIPSKERPPQGGLRRAPLLDAHVEIAVAAGRTAAASRSAEELKAIAEEFCSPALEAAAVLARARVSLSEGAASRAVTEAEAAVSGWVAVGAPYEAANARLVLADALVVDGRPGVAELECEAAATTLRRLGAPVPDRAASPGDRPGASAPAEATEGVVQQGVFRLDGDIRTVTFDGTTVRLKDLKGLRYLARLLAEPGREFHALDLVGVESGTVPRGTRSEVPEGRPGDAGLLLDDQARQAYRRRLTEIDDDIAEAEANHDDERAARARIEREYLVDELARAVGLGGRSRRAGDTSERARTSVTRTLRYALERIREHHPALATHLDATLQTGTYCCYEPDPRAPITWQT